MAYPSDLARTKNWGTEVLTDADLEGQLDLIITWLMAAMNETTGHKHDATENEAPKILVGGLANDAVETAIIKNLNVTTAKLAADAVDGTKIADDSVDSEHLAAGGIDPEHLAALCVETAKIAADAVTGAKIADDTIDSEHYAAGSIDAEHIASDAVETAKIKDANVTYAKFASAVKERVVKGWINFNGTGGIAIRDSYNVSSIVDNAVGRYTINWDTDFANDDYAAVGSGGDNAGSATFLTPDTYAVGSVQVNTRLYTSAHTDVDTITVMAIGDQ